MRDDVSTTLRKGPNSIHERKRNPPSSRVMCTHAHVQEEQAQARRYSSNHVRLNIRTYHTDRRRIPRKRGPFSRLVRTTDNETTGKGTTSSCYCKNNVPTLPPNLRNRDQPTSRSVNPFLSTRSLFSLYYLFHNYSCTYPTTRAAATAGQHQACSVVGVGLLHPSYFLPI